MKLHDVVTKLMRAKGISEKQITLTLFGWENDELDEGQARAVEGLFKTVCDLSGSDRDKMLAALNRRSAGRN